MPVALLVAGVLLSLVGIYWLHTVNKTSFIMQRIGGVITTMLGCVLVWGSAAIYTPPVINEAVTVDRSGPNWLVARLTFSPVRNCETEDFKAILIFGNNRVEVPALYVTSGIVKKQETNVSENFIYVAVINTLGISPDSFFIEATHSCPLGFTFNSHFPISNIPDDFNIGLIPDKGGLIGL